MADTPSNNETEAPETQAPGQEAAHEKADKTAAGNTPEESKGVVLDEFDAPQDKSQQSPTNENMGDSGLEAVYDIPVRVSAVLGETQMEINKLLKLGRGAVVVLDRKIGEAIDIYVNERLVARGEVVIADEDKLGITMTEIVKLPK